MQRESGFIDVGSESLQTIPTHYFDRTYELDNLRLSHQLNGRDLLGLLNGEAVYPRADPRGPFPRMSQTPPHVDPRTAEDYLREFVDEWIESAADENGTERPANRCLKSKELTPAQQAIWDYSLTLRMWVDGNGSMVLSGTAPNLPFTPAVGTLLGLTEDNPSYWLNHKQSAQAYFVSMMLSPLARQIAKCRTPGCGKYFLIKQPNHPYVGGTHCTIHADERDKQARAKFNSDGRDRACERLYETCVVEFRKGFIKPEWRADTNFLKSMVETLNMQIAGDPDLRSIYPKGITTTWFARKKNIVGLRTALILNKGASHAAR